MTFDLARRLALSPRLYLLVRLGLAVLFIYAGAVKLVDPEGVCPHYLPLRPRARPLLPVVAVGLPVMKLLAGIALLFNLLPGLHAVSGLLLLFAGVLGYGYFTNMDIDCGCFGPQEMAEQKGLVYAFYRDLGLLASVAFLHWSRIARGRPVSKYTD